MSNSSYDLALPVGERPHSRSALRAILKNALGKLHERVSSRVEDAASVSQDRILAAGGSINRIVDFARTYVQGTRDRMSEQVAVIDQYLAQVTETTNAHQQAVARALENAQAVEHSGAMVRQLAAQAKMLSINARIEARRAGSDEDVFIVIAREMRELSDAIAVTNHTVNESAGSLTASLRELQTLADKFHDLSKSFCDNMARLTEGTFGLDAEDANDAELGTILEHAYAALSSLQFQDPMVKGLRGVYGVFRRLRGELQEQLGIDLPELGEEAGPQDRVDSSRDAVDSSDVTGVGAGEVLLF